MLFHSETQSCVILYATMQPVQKLLFYKRVDYKAKPLPIKNYQHGMK